MSRFLHALAILVLVVAGLIVVGLVVGRAWIGSDGGRQWLARKIGQESGLKVKIGRLDRFGASGAELADVTVAGDGLYARVPQARLRWSLSELIDGKPDVRVHLKRPFVRLSGRPPLSLPRLPERAKLAVEIEDGRLQVGSVRRSLNSLMQVVHSPEGDELHARVRWGRDRAAIDGRLRHGRVDLEARDLRLTPFGMREYLPNWVEAPRGVITGSLTVRGPVDRLRVAGRFRAAGAQMIVRGRAALASQRADLRIRFRDLEPGALPSQERMVLNGTARVRLSRGRGRFVVDARYHHRRPDVQVPGASVAVASGGQLHGQGSLRTRRNLQANFVVAIVDRGHASRLVGQKVPAREVILRGEYHKRPQRQAALRLHTETR